MAPTTPTLQAGYTGYNDLQHLSQHQARDDMILQALETVTDKYHLLANLTNSPSKDLNIPKFLHWVLTAISDCSDLVTAFLNETPDADPQAFDQLMSTIAILTNIFEMHPGPGDPDQPPSADDHDDVLTPTQKHSLSNPHYTTTTVEPKSNILNTGDSSQVITQEQLTSLIDHLHNKGQRVAILELRKSEHIKQTKILQDTVDLLQTCISSQDDSQTGLTGMELLLKQNSNLRVNIAEITHKGKLLQGEVNVLHTRIVHSKESLKMAMLTKISLQTDLGTLQRQDIIIKNKKAELALQAAAPNQKDLLVGNVPVHIPSNPEDKGTPNIHHPSDVLTQVPILVPPTEKEDDTAYLLKWTPVLGSTMITKMILQM